MKLTRKEIETALLNWNTAWDNHDLEGVMALFHDNIIFDNWTGSIARGKAALEKAWAPWFENHGGFRFIPEETFIDEAEQKVLYRWQLQWPSFLNGYEGQLEIRRGVDVIHFQDGKIIKKLTYSKTTIEIDGKRHQLSVSGS